MFDLEKNLKVTRHAGSMAVSGVPSSSTSPDVGSYSRDTSDATVDLPGNI